MLSFFGLTLNDSKKWYLPYIANEEFLKFVMTTPFEWNVLDSSGYAPIHHVVHRSRNFSLLKIMIEHGDEKSIDFNIRNRNGWTPFHIVCGHGSIEMVKLLQNELQAKRIDPFTITSFGKVDIFVIAACNSKHKEVFRYLFSQFRTKFNVERLVNGYGEYKLIHWAVRNGHNEAVTFLLKSRSELGINLSDRADRRRTNIFHIALKKKQD